MRLAREPARTRRDAIGALVAALCLSGCYGHDVVAYRPGGGVEACALAPDPQPDLPMAVCACQDLSAADRLGTDAFDRCAAFAPGEGGGVGVNGRLDMNGPSVVQGDLQIGGASGAVAGGGAAVDVTGDLACAGPFLSDADLAVAGDARVQGNLRAQALTVGGTLTLPDGANLDVASQSVGALTRAPVTVAAPCPCDAPIDVAQVVASHASTNDDAAASLEPTSLRAAEGTVELACGQYYFTGVNGPGDLTLAVSAPASVYIDGDLTLQGDLHVELAAGASLDLWIAGTLTLPRGPDLGGEAEAGRVRVYVGGGGTLQLTGGGRFAGRLYAPRAEVVASGPLEVYGGVFARRIAASGPLDVHLDTAARAACP
ncbi:MAG: hypothetical protein KC933_19070 [Myxococcales bacterium]|nr:hypothetical protein [Myxococcales bacterium]MCB9647419.1 hypothetical protein [Deltaproteobacteria bacterium]